MKTHWPIRIYDILTALVVLVEAGRISDPRCTDALRLLASKHLATGGWPAEVRTARTVTEVTSGGTFADWGPVGRTRANPFISIDATWVLTAAEQVAHAADGPPGPAAAARSVRDGRTLR